MPIKVYNTLSGKIEEVRPRIENKLGMYVCGPTVYDYSHIGHARTYIAFDVMVRYLRYREFDVKYIVNITNIDDKIINRAKETGEDPFRLADKFETAFFEDMGALGVERADAYPRVSEHMPEIIEMVQTLVKKGFAYESDGDVYFDVTKITDFGKLSHQTMEEMKAGARVEIDEKKRNPADFALWKRAKEGEPHWKSPWGEGRPGWHIECSAMSMKYLGRQLDIHGGAKDLIFPHHENEIAQSEAYSGKKPFVRYWVHTGFLTIDGKKMSKSLGNIIKIKDLLSKYDPEVFRLFVLSTHYRRPVDFEEKTLNQLKLSLNRFYSTMNKLQLQIKNAEEVRELGKREKKIDEQVARLKQKFLDDMDNDFNTAKSLANLFKIARIGNKVATRGTSKQLLIKISDTITELGEIFGLFTVERKVKRLSEDERRLIEERNRARENKDWKKADEIREKLKEMGIMLRDYPEGTKWIREE